MNDMKIWKLCPGANTKLYPSHFEAHSVDVDDQVLAMLMGEFDFTTNFIKDTETPELAKVYFRYFYVT